MNSKAIVSAYQSLRKHDGNALVKRLRFAGRLMDLDTHKDRVGLVHTLVSHFGVVSGVSPSTVSKLTKVYNAFCEEDGQTPEAVADWLLKMRGHEAGIFTLWRALDKAEKAGGGVAEAWELLRSGKSLRSEAEKKADTEAGDEGEEGGEGSGGGTTGQPADPALQEIIKAVIEARQVGVEDEQILMALDELVTHAERHCGKEIVK